MRLNTPCRFYHDRFSEISITAVVAVQNVCRNGSCLLSMDECDTTRMGFLLLHCMYSMILLRPGGKGTPVHVKSFTRIVEVPSRCRAFRVWRDMEFCDGNAGEAGGGISGSWSQRTPPRRRHGEKKKEGKMMMHRG